MNYPGHKYLGPGNPVDNGPPVDSDDVIARQHDIEYDNATHDDHIRAADRKAIGAFLKDSVFPLNTHSIIGAAGLSAKYIFETVAGVQYPKNVSDRVNPMADNKRGADNMDEPAAKRPATDGSAAAALLTSNNEDQHSSGGSGASGLGMAGDLGRVMAPISNFTKGKIVFMHSRLLTSCGYQYKTLLQRDTGYSKTQALITTPYARVPVECLPWYLTHQEFKNLPPDCTVKRCSTMCQPLGYRTPFVTNSAATQQVNSNLFVLGMFAHGLNNRYQGLNMSITVAADKPMIPTNVTFVDMDDWKAWYGIVVEKEGSPLPFDGIPCSFGNIHPMRQYYCQNYDNQISNPTCPELMKSISLFHLQNSMDNPPIMWEYRPQISVLKPTKPINPYRTTESELNLGCKLTGVYKQNVFAGEDNVMTGGQSSKLTQKYMEPSYYTYIEQSGSITRGLSEPGGGLMPPSLHVGILPVQSSSSAYSEDHIQEVTCMYRFDTSIELEYSYETLFPEHNLSSAHHITFGDNRFLQLNQRHVHQWGYKGAIKKADATA